MAFVWLACSGAAPAKAQSPPAARLVVQPAAIELRGPHATHAILVTAIAADGALADVTAMATFECRQPTVATVSRHGEIAAAGDGQAEIVVRFAGQAATVAAVVRDFGTVPRTSFVNDVVPLLTRLGCNQGSCHGKGAGQNGFRLSLRGYAPELDHQWVAREFWSRRLNPLQPEASLVLRKPSGQAPHAGGRLFEPNDRAYQTLLDWIRTGVAEPVADEPHMSTLELLPGDRTLHVGQSQPLLVRATYTDGLVRDVTWLAKFDVNDPGMLEVSPLGQLTVLHQGETAVRATFQGFVAVAVMTVPFERQIAPELFAARNNFIDEHVNDKLAALRIVPGDLCGDAEFIRRAFLDTIGLLPTSDEARNFLADTAADKRAKIVEQLLERPEYVDFWALQLGDVLQNRKERDHDVRGTKGVRAFHEWLRAQLAANRPWNELARLVLTASGKSSENPAIGYFVVTVGENREAERSEVAASVAQAFLGTRIGCSKCHNHPLERYTQDDYYHFAAFFSRIRFERQEAKKGPTTLTVSHPDPNQNSQPVGVSQPRTGRFMKPQPLDRSAIEVAPADDPRVKLVEWMTSPANDYFAGAMVNRLWRHFMGTGLVEPVDDLRTSNPPSNPRLWKALIGELVGHGFDLKHIMRAILNSRAYQRTSTTLVENQADVRFQSHYLARRLPDEVLLDALSSATGIPDRFPGYPEGVRAVQLPDPGSNSYFLGLFGRSERVTACACERSGDVTLPQLLHLINGDELLRKISADEGRLGRELKLHANNGPVIDELYLATLSRPPAPEERSIIEQALAGGERSEVFRDLLWALLNSKEFTFNH